MKQLYLRNKEVMLNRAKKYYQNNKEVLGKKARDNYRKLLDEQKSIKREYGKIDTKICLKKIKKD